MSWPKPSPNKLVDGQTQILSPPAPVTEVQRHNPSLPGPLEPKIRFHRRKGVAPNAQRRQLERTAVLASCQQRDLRVTMAFKDDPSVAKPSIHN